MQIMNGSMLSSIHPLIEHYAFHNSFKAVSLVAPILNGRNTAECSDSLAYIANQHIANTYKTRTERFTIGIFDC